MSFQDDLSDLDDATFDMFGRDATWNGVAVRIQTHEMTEQGEYGESRAVADVLEIRVRRREVPQPAKGDVVIFGSDAYVIYERPEVFGSGTQWRCYGDKAP